MSTVVEERTKQCIVLSDKMDKSRVGRIVRTIKHPLLGKYIKRHTKIMFHDETNESRSGDVVLIKEQAPISKRKNFKLVSVVKKIED